MKSMYPSLTEMAQELERQNAAKVDYLAPADRIHFISSIAAARDGESPVPRSEIDLLGTEAGSLVVNEIAHGHFSDRLKIPKRFYDRLRGELPSLLDENVNRLLRYRADDGAPPKWMVRTLDGVARAALSDSYRRIDNWEIAQAVLPILGDLPGVQIRSCALTDKRMYIKATTNVEHEVRVGATVRAGVHVGNSEVGYGSVVVFPFVETLQCTNGMTITHRGDGMMRQIHLGRRVEADGTGRIFRDETRKADDHAFILALGDVVRAAVDEARFSELVAEMAKAAESAPVQDVGAAVEVLQRREGLSETEGRGILQHLAEGGDLTRWGVLSAVTRTAEDVESYDRANELETLGGKILAYSARDWRELAEAAA